MLEWLQYLNNLEWRRAGAAFHSTPIAGSRIWFAEFTPRTGGGKRPRPAARDGRRSPEDRPDPPALVLLHGIGGTSCIFAPVIARLRHAYRLVVPDYLGLGSSRLPTGRDFLTLGELVELVRTLVARVAPAGAYVAGNSVGGWIAAKLAAQCPELVRGLALLNPAGAALRPEDYADFDLREFVRTGESRNAAAWLKRMFYRPPLAMRLFLRDCAQIMRSPLVTKFLENLAPGDFLSAQELARVRCPSVLIWGLQDRVVPDSCRTFYLENVKGIRYEPLAGCGHLPQVEFPERTAEILLDLALAGSVPSSEDAAGLPCAGERALVTRGAR